MATAASTSRRHTADSLLAVAVAEFTERGYDGTSMEDLARAAGITKSSIYHHMSGKEALLKMAIDRALDALFAVAEEPGGARGPGDRPARSRRTPQRRGAGRASSST